MLNESQKPAAASLASQQRKPLSAMDQRIRNAALQRLRDLRLGCVRILDDHAEYILGDPRDDLQAQVKVNDNRFWRMLASGGSLGAGEAYMYGLWDSPDLTAVVRVLARNRDVLPELNRQNWLQRKLMQWWHARNRNSLQGSRRNISAHYDLSNEFFSLWLDQGMNYSSAWFSDQASDDMTLEAAQTAKLERICTTLQVKPGDRIMEIGCGWGDFALHAAQQHGCHVTATTISAAQLEHARQRIEAAGLQDQIALISTDYRELQGQFDHVVSIEMIEAVGHHYVDGYFAKIASLLHAQGQALIQAITIEDHRYEQALHNVDYIKRYIFPGSFIPGLQRLQQSIQAAGLQTVEAFDIGLSYARTLGQWRQRFCARLDEIRALGFDEQFIRMWLYYFAYCEGGFAERAISDVQLHLRKA